jgi:uncharacterized protein (TIGR02453 family)
MTTTTTSTAPAFAGFPAEGLALLAALREDNSRACFDAHRDTYETALLAPAKAFVVALAGELAERVSPDIRAEPRVDGSILRLNRDLRFNAGQGPYKDYLDMVVWGGKGRSREHPGFFVRLRPEGVELGAGIHRFERVARDAYRAAVLDDGAGAALEDVITLATARRGVSIEPTDGRRVPRGVDPGHPRAALLTRGGLYAHGRWDTPRALSTRGFVRWAATRLEGMAPVERWLTRVLDDDAA